LKVSTSTGKIETPDRNVPAHDKGIPLPPTDEYQIITCESVVVGIRDDTVLG